MTEPAPEDRPVSYYAALVPDPDPEREHIRCLDCSTPTLVVTDAGEIGQVLGVQHDSACPFYAAMTADERHVTFDGGVIVHVAVGD